jgi:spore coat polysaccharide biosynthesis protein SpsF
MIVGILQVRTSSSRLPRKALCPIIGRPMLSHQLERLRRARRLDRLVVATSGDLSDNGIQQLCESLAVECFRGSLEDVLDRFYQAAKSTGATDLVRLTGDCPLADPNIIDQVIDYYLKSHLDYVSNTLEPTFPDGLDVEVFSFRCLEAAAHEARLPSHREHVTPFIYSQPQRFTLGNFRCARDLSHLRWTVDQAADLELIREIYHELYPANPAFGMDDILDLLGRRPELLTLNSELRRNAGLDKSSARDREFLKKETQSPNRAQ